LKSCQAIVIQKIWKIFLPFFGTRCSEFFNASK
jgi:hypothetical protein